MKKCVSILVFAAMLLTGVASATAKVYELRSPDQRLQCTIELGDSISYSLSDGTVKIVEQCRAAMEWADGATWGGKGEHYGVSRRSGTDEYSTQLYKYSHASHRYNELTVNGRKGCFRVTFRLYNDGLAYRFGGKVEVGRTLRHEEARFRLPDDAPVWVGYIQRRGGKANPTVEEQYYTDQQSLYTHCRVSEMLTDNLVLTPLVAELAEGRRLCITESDVADYPGMFGLATGRKGEIVGHHTPYPSKIEVGGKNDLEDRAMEFHDYIYRCDDTPYNLLKHGERNFPWRALIVARNDGELVSTDMVYRLAGASAIGNDSWIKPGMASWEWWSNCDLRGVDFNAGVNTATYLHFIDFSARRGIPYLVIDAGWTERGSRDLRRVVPEVNIDKIISYANSKGVGIILWAGYGAIADNVDHIIEHYAKKGAKGFKIDYLNRDDQLITRGMHHIADVCARHHMLIDYHGCAKPMGLNRTYPNVVNFEAVYGLEQMKWAKPEVDMVSHDVILPFIRQVAGPMDYTQGAMRNATRKEYNANNDHPMSQGTRCRQVAEFVVFESPLNMLCDSPSNYDSESETIDFIASLPTTWDETRTLGGEIGKYVVVARRKGTKWYVGALTDWESRSISVELPQECIGRSITTMSDGINAGRNATDYRQTHGKVESATLTINMAPGGGFTAIID